MPGSVDVQEDTIKVEAKEKKHIPAVAPAQKSKFFSGFDSISFQLKWKQAHPPRWLHQPVQLGYPP
jgi:hypothetical protein